MNSASPLPPVKSAPYLRLHSLGVLFFLYAPMGVMVFFSFNQGQQSSVWEGFSTDWYHKLFQNERLWNSLKNSLKVAGITTVIATLLGTTVAIAMKKACFPGRRFTHALLMLPVIIPEVVIGAALVTFFGVAQFDLTLTTVTIAHVVFSIPYIFFLVWSRLEGWEPAWEEAARDLGASPLSVLMRVTLPLLLPAIIAGALLVFTISLDDYVITSFVAGAGATTLPVHIYSMLKVNVTPEVNAICTLLLGFTLILIIAAQWLLNLKTTSDER